MNLKWFLIWQLLLLYLLITQSYRFANANDDDGDDDDDDASIDNNKNNLFEKRYDLPSDPEDEALRAIRDYIDLLCINWNGFYLQLPQNRRILNFYLHQVSLAYARVLHYYRNDHEVISRTMHEQFMRHVVTRMRDVIRINEDSPVRDGPVVVEYNFEAGQIETNHIQRRERWSYPRFDLNQPRNAIVSRDELAWLVYLRVPYTESNEERPPKPFYGWKKHTHPNQEYWPGLDLDRHFSYNHFVPYLEVNWLLQRYNELWLESNDGNLWYSDVMLINLEIRLSRLAILRADLEMNAPGTRSLLSNVRHYITRALSYNAWPSGNLFIGPVDRARLPRPSKSGQERFETHAAEVLRSPEWAREGRALTKDILFYRDRVPQRRHDLHEILDLINRYLRLLQSSGSADLWALSGQGVAPVSPSQYDISENSFYWQVRKQMERRVAEDVERVERRLLIDQEHRRLRNQGYAESVIRNTIDQELKPFGKIHDKLNAIYKEKLNNEVKEWLDDKDIYENIYSGPKHSVEWKNVQKTIYCVLGKMSIKRKICGRNILFGEASTSGLSSSPVTSSNESPDELFDNVLNHVTIVGSDTEDSGIFSGGNSRRQSNNDETCGVALDQVNLYMDPGNHLSNVPPDVYTLKVVDNEYRRDAINSAKGLMVDNCFRHSYNGTRENFREKREVTKCSRKVVNELWYQCENLIEV